MTALRTLSPALLCVLFLVADIFLIPFEGHGGVIRHVEPGRYGGRIPPEHAVYFHVVSNRIRNLLLMMPVSCTNSETGESYLRAYSLGSATPVTLRLRQGVARGEFGAVNNAGGGRIQYRITLNGPRGRASFAAYLTGESGAETCAGSFTVAVRRSR